MTSLTSPVSRQTAKLVGGKPVIVTLAPAGSQSEALIGLRLKGQKTTYLATVSDVYRMAALWYGQKEAAAKREARRAGEPWSVARRRFRRENSIT